jgi:hypothetical protein
MPGSSSNSFFEPLSNPEIKEHFKNYATGAYSSNPELQQFGRTIGNFVSGQPISFTDKTGTVNIDPVNQGFSVQPHQGFGLSVKGKDMMRGGTPSVEATFQFGNENKNLNSTSDVENFQPVKSAGRKFAEEYIDANKLREAARYYYR